MPDDLQSIEDLIAASSGMNDDASGAPAKFQAKHREIKIKELERVTRKQAESLGVPYVNLYGFPISPEALSLISEEEARKNSVVCFFYNGANLRIGTTKPVNAEVKRIFSDLTERYYCLGKIYQLSEHSLLYALDLYKRLPKVRIIERGVRLTEEDLSKFSVKFSSFRDLQKEIDKAQVTDIVTMIFAAGVKSESSDIHIEAEEDTIKVRFRIDGVLHDAATMPMDLWKKIISRMKILTKVKINIVDKPQDGRLTILMKDDRIDIRASFLPTNFGESVVLRLLRSSSVGLAFEDLGISDRAYRLLSREIERPNGMIITTGPTGSGKTTTLYAILKKLNKPETKIITIEDPIEYQLEGINQSQTSDRYTFAQGLRSIVRQDPDILMVGEIRDLETAEIAIQAALTGHLVLSTIHTNDAAGTVPRFMSMGTKPFLLAPALNAMIGQRLVRRLCKECRIEVTLSPDIKERVINILEKLPADDRQDLNLKNMKFFTGKGCDTCQGIGFKGRIGIYEIMIMDSEIEKVILSGKVSEYEMRDLAAKKGMVTMVQDGLLKALQGITSVEEVFRVAEEK